MIRSFDCRNTEKIWNGQSTRVFPSHIQDRILRKLRQIDSSSSLEDLKNPPGNHLEILKKDRLGQFSIRINDQWRICFRFINGDAFDVAVVDYH